MRRDCFRTRFSAWVTLALTRLPVIAKATDSSSPMPRERDPVYGAILTIIALIGVWTAFASTKIGKSSLLKRRNH